MKPSRNALLSLVTAVCLFGCRYEQEEKPDRYTDVALQVMVSEGVCSNSSDCIQRRLIRTKSSKAITPSSDITASADILEIYEASDEIGSKIANAIGPLLSNDSRCVVVRVHLKSGKESKQESMACPAIRK